MSVKMESSALLKLLLVSNMIPRPNNTPEELLQEFATKTNHNTLEVAQYTAAIMVASAKRIESSLDQATSNMQRSISVLDHSVKSVDASIKEFSTTVDKIGTSSDTLSQNLLNLNRALLGLTIFGTFAAIVAAIATAVQAKVAWDSLPKNQENSATVTTDNYSK